MYFIRPVPDSRIDKYGFRYSTFLREPSVLPVLVTVAGPKPILLRRNQRLTDLDEAVGTNGISKQKPKEIPR